LAIFAVISQANVLALSEDALRFHRDYIAHTNLSHQYSIEILVKLI
jgi:hypothetical protein